jgi:hypothetical protein
MPALERDDHAFAQEERAMSTDTMNAHVSLLQQGGEWLVRVAADGHETVTGFELESFARAFAEGQRLRFGLERFDCESPRALAG